MHHVKYFVYHWKRWKFLSCDVDLTLSHAHLCFVVPWILYPHCRVIFLCERFIFVFSGWVLYHSYNLFVSSGSYPIPTISGGPGKFHSIFKFPSVTPSSHFFNSCPATAGCPPPPVLNLLNCGGHVRDPISS